jgi:hypothetical protein
MFDESTSNVSSVEPRKATTSLSAIMSSETPGLSFVEAVELRHAQRSEPLPDPKVQNTKRYLRWTTYLIIAIVLTGGAVTYLELFHN